MVDLGILVSLDYFPNASAWKIVAQDHHAVEGGANDVDRCSLTDFDACSFGVPLYKRASRAVSNQNYTSCIGVCQYRLTCGNWYQWDWNQVPIRLLTARNAPLYSDPIRVVSVSCSVRYHHITDLHGLRVTVLYQIYTTAVPSVSRASGRWGAPFMCMCMCMCMDRQRLLRYLSGFRSQLLESRHAQQLLQARGGLALHS